MEPAASTKLTRHKGEMEKDLRTDPPCHPRACAIQSVYLVNLYQTELSGRLHTEEQLQRGEVQKRGMHPCLTEERLNTERL